MKTLTVWTVAAVVGSGVLAAPAWAASTPQDILKEGLMGAAVGAVSSEVSGGKAGKGALIGAGTNIIGSALLGILSGPSGTQTSYVQQTYAPAPVSQPVYYTQAPSYVSYPQETYYAPAPSYSYSAPAPAANANTQILRSGLLGAGVGAISAEASGGKAGTGALVGAGTNVIGGALIDTFFSSQKPQQTSYYYGPAQTYVQPASAQQGAKKKIVRKFDANGNVISEEEFWQ